MKPMLAKKFNPLRVTYPLYVQPKYNGIRCLALKTHLQSRDEHTWNSDVLPHLFTELTRQGIPFDGELYKHGMSLQQINSRVSVVRNGPHDDVRSVQYYLFDIISREPFSRRAQALDKLREMNQSEHVVVVPTYRVNTAAEADFYFQQFIAEGYEGMMYRTPNDGYGLEMECGNKENRWDRLLKRKQTMDLDAVILEVHEGEGKYVGMVGSFLLQLPNGVTFNAGSGLTDDERVIYWKHRNIMAGLIVKIEFEMFSDGGVPLKPIIALVDVAF